MRRKYKPQRPLTKEELDRESERANVLFKRSGSTTVGTNQHVEIVVDLTPQQQHSKSLENYTGDLPDW